MNDQPLTIDVFLDRLDIGEYDDRLEEIRDRVRQRRTELEQRLLRTLKPGDTVRFSSTASPKYLQGLPATFLRLTEKKGKTCAMLKTPDDPKKYKRFSGRDGIRAPASILERI